MIVNKKYNVIKSKKNLFIKVTTLRILEIIYQSNHILKTAYVKDKKKL